MEAGRGKWGGGCGGALTLGSKCVLEPERLRAPEQCGWGNTDLPGLGGRFMGRLDCPAAPRRPTWPT